MSTKMFMAGLMALLCAMSGVVGAETEARTAREWYDVYLKQLRKRDTDCEPRSRRNRRLKCRDR